MTYRRNGFVLIELLVVIVILSVLAVIVIPQIINQIEVERVAHDRVTLRTVRSAVHLFFAEHNAFPAAADFPQLAGPLEPFLDLPGGEMPRARSRGRTFYYFQATGEVSISPELPPVQ